MINDRKQQSALDDRNAGHVPTATVGPNGKYLSDTRSFISLSQVGATKTATTIVPATGLVTSTAHAARVGDIIRMVDGAAIGLEFTVFSVTDVNNFTLGETFVDTIAIPVSGDTYDLLRPTMLTVSPTGNLAVSGLVEFTRNGANQIVTEDTATPANNRPLPVIITGLNGNLEVTAQNLNIQSTHTGANPDSMQIGNGTNLMAVNASLEAQVRDDDANTSLSSIDTKIPAQGAALIAASTPVNIASDQTVPISAASLPLPTGAATEATLVTIDTDTGVIAGDTTSIDGKTPALGGAVIASSVPVNIASDQTVPISAASLPLPSGAATEATLSTLNAKFVTGTDIGDVTINNASGGSAVNIQDGGNSITVDSADLSTLAGTVVGSEQQVDIVAALPTGTNKIGIVDSESKTPAATTVKNAQLAVGTTEIRLTSDAAAVSSTRSLLRFRPDPASVARFFYGATGVSTANGIEVFPGELVEMNFDAGEYFIISDTAAQTVQIIEQE